MRKFQIDKQLIVYAVLLFGTLSIGFVPRQTDAYFEVTKNIDIFGKVLKEVSINYVDEIETNKFVRKGVDAMLGSLDPYTNFIPASEIEDYRFLSTGEYGGIGSRVAQRDGKFIITEPYEGKPADEAGVKAGDEIVAIDGEDITNDKYNVKDISNMLRGEANTNVKIKVKRFGRDEPLELTIVRNKVKIDNVPFYGMVTEEIGYITLTGFTQNASGEIKKAYEALKADHPKFNKLILDLRGNPGGLLFEAIKISNLFVNKGEKIVETKGRMEGSLKVYESPADPLDTEMPIAVLINGRSASASEIVSGVMQDLDRGIVVGRQSFGKGLVQTTRPLSYNNQIKITTARYYTPSGRCIQAINYGERDANGSVLRTPDSLMHVFKTRRGRPVLDAGGIRPDIPVEAKELHKITQELLRQHLVFDFATQYHYTHESIPAANKFEITDEIYDEFVAYVKKQEFDYDSDAEKAIKQFKERLEEEAYYDELEDELGDIKKAIDGHRQRDIYAHRNQISRYLKTEIALRYYYDAGRREADFKEDTDVLAAVKALEDQTAYNKVFEDMETLSKRETATDVEADEGTHTSDE